MSFINKFSSIIVSHIANNPDEGPHHFADLTRGLKEFLKNTDRDFEKLIGGNSMDYLRAFFIDALFTKLTQWWKAEDSRNVPALEQSAIASCMKLKAGGLNIEDVLKKASKRFSIPLVSVEMPKSPHIFSGA